MSLDTHGADEQLSADRQSLVISLNVKKVPEVEDGSEQRKLNIVAASATRHELEAWLQTVDSQYELLPPEGMKDGVVQTSSPVLQLTANAATIAAIENQETRPPSIKRFEPLFEASAGTAENPL